MSPQEARYRASSVILEAIRAFEQETGCEVDGLELETIDVTRIEDDSQRTERNVRLYLKADQAQDMPPTNRRMTLVLEAPQPGKGLTRTMGAKLYTPCGEAIPGIAKIKIGIEPNDLVRAIVTLNSCVIEYAKPGEAP